MNSRSLRRLAPLAALAAVIAVAAPSEATYPTGTVAATTAGLSSQTYELFPSSASPAGVVYYTIDRMRYTQSATYVKTPSGSPVALTGAFDSYDTEIHGSNLTLAETYNGDVLYRAMGSATQVACAYASGGTYELGGVFSDRVVRYLENGASGSVLQQALVTGSGCPTWTTIHTFGVDDTTYINDVIAGPAGLVVQVGGTGEGWYYVSLTSPDSPVVLNPGGDISSYVSVGTNALSWYDYDTHKVNRLSLSPSASVVSLAVTEYVTQLVTTPSATVWLQTEPGSTGRSRLKLMPAAGTSPTAGPYGHLSGLAWDGSTYFVGIHETAANSGLAGTTAVSSAPSLIVHGATTALGASSVVVSQGRETYTTNKGAFDAWSVYRRPLTGGGTSVTQGAETLIRSHASGYSLSVSGRHTVFGDTGAGGETDLYHQVDGAAPIRIALGSYFPTVSGLRLLYRTSGGAWKLRDLRPGGATSILPAGYEYGLWGDYLVGNRYTDGLITYKTLSTGTTVTVRSATVPVEGTSYYVGSVSVYGNVVAWAERKYTTTTYTQTVYWKNIATGVVHHLAVAELGEVRASAGYVLYTKFAGSPTYDTILTRVPANPPTSTITSTVVTNSLEGDFSVDDERFGVVGDDGMIHAGPLPAFTYRPRYLGLRSAEGSFKPGTTNPTWDLDVPFSKALTTCTVTIKKGTTAVRALPCSTTSGEAKVSWDGKNSSGVAQAAGTYTWSIAAGDGEGAFLSAGGGAVTLSGSFTRTA